jgi:hypothetical protein
VTKFEITNFEITMLKLPNFFAGDEVRSDIVRISKQICHYEPVLIEHCVTETNFELCNFKFCTPSRASKLTIFERKIAHHQIWHITSSLKLKTLLKGLGAILENFKFKAIFSKKTVTVDKFIPKIKPDFLKTSITFESLDQLFWNFVKR